MGHHDPTWAPAVRTGPNSGPGPRRPHARNLRVARSRSPRPPPRAKCAVETVYRSHLTCLGSPRSSWSVEEKMSNLRDEIANSTQSMRERCMGKGRFERRSTHQRGRRGRAMRGIVGPQRGYSIERAVAATCSASQESLIHLEGLRNGSQKINIIFAKMRIERQVRLISPTGFQLPLRK